MSYGLGASIALAPAPAMPRIPMATKGISLSTPNATPWGTLKPSINVSRPIAKLPLILPKFPVLLAPKSPVTSKPVATTLPVLKPSVSTVSAPSPQTSLMVPSGASTGTSLVPVSSGDETATVEVNTFNAVKSPVVLVGLGLLALFLLNDSKKRR